MNSKIYLDYAATTPVDPAVVKAMKPYFETKCGNPASLHWAGQVAQQAVSEARESLAAAIGAKAEEIIFTSSATEANNLALKGVAAAHKNKVNEKPKRHKILISAVEHDCVLNSAKWLTTQGWTVEQVPVDEFGQIKLAEFEKMLDEQVLLVSVMHASNEIGTIQPIQKVGQLCHEKGIIFHTDAAQTFGKLPLNVGQLNIDLLTASGHKIYGPKGAGLLYRRQGVALRPILHGGGQENGLRSSTLNVPGIVGFAKAAQVALEKMEAEAKKISQLRDQLIESVLQEIPQTYLNGHPQDRLYNNVNFRFDFIEGEGIVLRLSNKGIAASTGSACSSPKLTPSHVLLATGLSAAQAHGSLRLSLGRWTTQEEIEYVSQVLPKIIKDLRHLSPIKE